MPSSVCSRCDQTLRCPIRCCRRRFRGPWFGCWHRTRSSHSPARELVLQDAEDMKQFTKQELESLIGVDARDALRRNLARSEEWFSTVSVQKRAHDNADSAGRAATALDGRLNMAFDGSASAGAALCLRVPLTPHASCGHCFATDRSKAACRTHSSDVQLDYANNLPQAI